MESFRQLAIQPLRQMSHWTYWDDASMALVLLGRIAEVPEERLQTLLEARDAAAILDQFRPWTFGSLPPPCHRSTASTAMPEELSRRQSTLECRAPRIAAVRSAC